MGITFNPFTGTFDFVNEGDTIQPENFSYTHVADSEIITIPSGQEMVVKSDVMVDGVLDVQGDIFQLPDPPVIPVPPEPTIPFFWTKILSSESILIPENRLLLYSPSIMVEGNLIVNGDLVGV